MKKILICACMALMTLSTFAQTYEVPVSEQHEKMQMDPDFRKSITSVYLLGYGKLKATQTAEGLIIVLPQPCRSARMAACQSKNQIAPVLRINK